MDRRTGVLCPVLMVGSVWIYIEESRFLAANMYQDAFRIDNYFCDYQISVGW